MKTFSQFTSAIIIAANCAATLEAPAADVPASPVAHWSFRSEKEKAPLRVPSSPELCFADVTFSVTAWVNPYKLGGEQQMIIAKNDYSAGKREWGLMLDKDDRFRFYLRQEGWKTVASQTKPRPGHWHHVAVTVEKGNARLYINGKQEAEAQLAATLTATDAPVTIGGSLDGGRARQMFTGALDEVSVFRSVLTPAAIQAMADKQPSPIKIAVVEPVAIWTGGAVPKVAGVPLAKGVEVHTIANGAAGIWMKGVHVAWHKNKLYASVGYNDKLKEQGENSPGEQARVCTSDDGGKTWSAMQTIAAGQGDMGISHGVFLSHGGRLWSFNGAFHGKIGKVHTRAFRLDEQKGEWEPMGVVVKDGFWPLQEPIKMDDGNWIMSGARVGDGNPAAVAISHGDDLTKWDLVVIPKAANKMWGESSVIVEGKRIINIARCDGSQPVALVAVSEDYGRTWTPSRPSNLPMSASRPYANILSTGQRYLVAITTADSGNKREPLTIAVSAPGETQFCRVLKVFKGNGTYPAAVEHGGVLYIGFTDKHTPKIAVVPVESLTVPPPVKIWDGKPVPTSAEIPALKDVRFSVIKPYEFDKDGYRFLHGVALCFHKGKLYASFGHNKGGENTDSEEARLRVSDDDGKTWGPVTTIDPGDEPGIGVSHGVFLSHKGRLWAFHGAYSGTMQNIHTRAYLLDESISKWEHKGVIIKGGFWPLEPPVKMADGNWIISGISARGDAPAGGKNPAAVAISHGDNLTKWDLVVIPTGDNVGKMWGESAVIVNGKHITNIARYGDHAQALVAMSDDFGRTWTPSLPSNLPMATSKPCAGMLSTGQRYLICSTSADGGKRRAPLTIAVSKPGETKFSKVFVIRHAEFPTGPGESHAKVSLAYPCATEHDGKLYVGYSNSGGGVNRKGTGRELWNNNSAELAVIPLSSLSLK
ncbi:MAG: hypothetical protein FJ395_03080 [Verrucomicrobia bacterium]|nr:hypothetical protein [Verrucomicrobiota bacterium]